MKNGEREKNISHQIRNSMAIVRGRLRMIQEEVQGSGEGAMDTSEVLVHTERAKEEIEKICEDIEEDSIFECSSAADENTKGDA